MHFFLVIYVVGPYLTFFMPEDLAGLVISLGAVITLFSFPLMPHLVRKYGAKKLAVGLAALQAIILSVLAGSPSAVIAIIAVALTCAISPLIAYGLDLLLEATVAQENATGRIRTAFLTAANVALVLSPLLVGKLLDGGDRYDFVFLAAAFSLTPFIMLFLVESLPEGEPPRRSQLVATGMCIVHDPDLRAIAVANASLQLFFHLAPLYVPLYLHLSLGIPWSELGWIFAVAVVPFVLLEYPAGWLADRYIGDKEMLMVGFVIMGVSFALFAFVTAATPIYIIVTILVATRVGAALTEAMVEGHFFRRVSERDPNTVSVFRMMRPGGALLAPIIGSIVLAIGTYEILFAVTGIAIALVGFIATLRMQDVR